MAVLWVLGWTDCGFDSVQRSELGIYLAQTAPSPVAEHVCWRHCSLLFWRHRAAIFGPLRVHQAVHGGPATCLTCAPRLIPGDSEARPRIFRALFASVRSRCRGKIGERPRPNGVHARPPAPKAHPSAAARPTGLCYRKSYCQCARMSAARKEGTRRRTRKRLCLSIYSCTVWQ